MATFNQIKKLRLQINDPAGIINIIDIGAGTLPGDFEKQTAYKKGGVYYVAHDDAANDHLVADLYLSDESLSDLIDNNSFEASVYKCYEIIQSKIGNELRLESINSSTETTKYTSLTSLFNYYEKLIGTWKSKADSNINTSTGLMGRMRCPVIAGGNI